VEIPPFTPFAAEWCAQPGERRGGVDGVNGGAFGDRDCRNCFRLCIPFGGLCVSEAKIWLVCVLCGANFTVFLYLLILTVNC
jgi:hypothetical protein